MAELKEAKEAKKYIKTGTASIIIGIFLLIMIVIVVLPKEKAVDYKAARAAEEKYPYVSLHSFPDGVKQISIPIGPERWEGITLPLGTTAYRIDPTVWHQLKPWDGKPGPIVMKGEAVHRIVPIRNRIKKATFWLRGEREATITIE